jgi:hydroxymethylpyrimidine/phosphomethylpyrimidine kinase
MRIALAISASDPTGGAGLQADLQVFRSLGVHGCGVLSALTLQDSSKVRKLLPVFPSVVLDQLRVLLGDIQPSAVKIGALASDDVARSVLLGLDDLAPDTPLVLDPVLFASDGSQLLERRAWDSLRALISRCTLVTPNLHEAEQLSGLDLSSKGGNEAAARYFIEELGAQAALIKGGHRDGAPDDLLALRGDLQPGSEPVASSRLESDRGNKPEARLDRTSTGEALGGGRALSPAAIEMHWLEGERVDRGPVHGTGCALSSAIAAGLARGQSLLEAVEQGRHFVVTALRSAEAPGAGSRLLVY